ncbi:hypothetical protein F5Y11DRAFT_364230 [Daldinia sp. FL1419]|nr:hypothetical protein F5Y11DRAFT_364230 [Daldinia sp. FL1419]
MKLKPKVVFTDKIIIDNNERVEVAVYNFCPDIYFALSSSMPASAWISIWEEEVVSIWLFALNSPDCRSGLPNLWKIALVLGSGKVVTLELSGRQYSGPRDAGWPQCIICRAFRDKGKPKDDLSALKEAACFSTGRDFKERVQLKQIVRQANRYGDVTNYRLTNNRGRRYWLFKFLERTAPLIRKIHGVGSLHQAADRAMRYCMLPRGGHTQHYGYDDNNLSPLKIVAGSNVYAQGRWASPL